VGGLRVLAYSEFFVHCLFDGCFGFRLGSDIGGGLADQISKV
jgi:hypothetical protein